MMEEYLKELKEKDFIREKKIKTGRTYEITEKGINYLDKYNMIANFTESFGLG